MRNFTGLKRFYYFYSHVKGFKQKKYNSKVSDFNIFNSMNLKSVSNLRKNLQKGAKIVAIGGGTGLSTMLRGLKMHTSNLTAVVTVADDGGGSGILRKDLGIIPPGDIRNCILALAETEPVMEQLLQYRFQEGMLKGQSFGNLFLAAMNGISSSFVEAVKRMSDVLAVKGKVLPVTTINVQLCAELENGEIIIGESKIGERNPNRKCRIKRVYLKPENAKPLDEVLEAINEAEAIIMGPGSLYTSIMPNLVVPGISEAIKNSKAIKIYVCNIMTQPGETDGYTVTDHIKAIEDHTFNGIIDYCIVNTASIPQKLKEKYLEEGAQVVRIDCEKIKELDINMIYRDLIDENNNFLRHDPRKLAMAITDIINRIYKNKRNKLNHKISGETSLQRNQGKGLYFF
ncbi:MAG TPA: YvcK family protein [Clostridiaceae bacterium]|nr:YvcK family protein [Clostridiaceae bacterium]